MTVPALMLKPVEPDHPCDRCAHPARFHDTLERGYGCMIAEGRVWGGKWTARRPRATKCWCDGYVPAP